MKKESKQRLLIDIQLNYFVALKYLFQYLLLPVMLILPKSVLLRLLQNKLMSHIFTNVGCSKIFFYKSGRSALRALMSALKEQQNRGRVLVPDYICNVVPQACLDAGVTVQTYPTDEKFMPNWDMLRQLIKNDEQSVLILCSIMGAFPANSRQVSELKREFPSLFIVSDECQNLIPNYPVGFENISAIIFSFNDKTCPGLMGGGVIVSSNMNLLLASQSLTMKRKLYRTIILIGSLVKRIVRELNYILKLLVRYYKEREGSLCCKYEYSMCQTVIYDTLAESIHKISVAFALLMLRYIDEYTRLREENYKQVIDIVDYECIENVPPFVPLKKEYINRVAGYLPMKLPYACADNPNQTAKEIYSLKLNIPYILLYKEKLPR